MSVVNLPIYQIDAFAEKIFEGNPAAVVPLQEWLSEELMGLIAAENNLSETAFFVPVDNHFYIRWFTPNGREVELCGHATLASAFVLFNCLDYQSEDIIFESLSGNLSVTQNNDLLTLDFPQQAGAPCEAPALLTQGLGAAPSACYSGEDYMVVFESEDELAQLSPDYDALARLDRRGVIATAPSTNYDFVVRFFAPKYGIKEDAVTGSAYTQLIPYWSKKTSRKKLLARQISERGGTVHCELQGERVFISGSAVKYLEGVIAI